MAHNNHPCDCEEVSSPSVSNGGQRYDEILAALADTRRRWILYYLQEEEQASLRDVAKQTAAWEYGDPATELPDELIDEFETMLYHNHLPRLREASIVEYDQRSEQLLLRDPPKLVEICLDHCADCDPPSN